MHFADQLIDAIDEKRAPVCVGIDPIYERLPEDLTGPAAERNLHDARRIIDAYYDFIVEVLRIVAPLVPVVKLQSAYFERYRHEGVEAYFALMREAKDLGLLVIGDVKRGDIGTTSDAYAAGHLADFDFESADDFASPDAITVNPMLGPDTIEPFLKVAVESEKGLFALVRTSNPGSAVFQDVKLADGRSWSEMLADELHKLAQSTPLGRHGYSPLGAVVGVTQPEAMVSLRRRLPTSIFLLPGYGTQGGTAEMSRAAFDENRRGALISASRSILYPPPSNDDWRTDIRNATRAMIEDVRRIFG